MTKAKLQAVLHARGDDDRPFLAQFLPGEFDTDDYPNLLPDLGLAESDLQGERAEKAEQLAALDADPHSRVQDEWRPTEIRDRHATLEAELDGGSTNGRRTATD
jgi:hypothetical protein